MFEFCFLKLYTNFLSFNLYLFNQNLYILYIKNNLWFLELVKPNQINKIYTTIYFRSHIYIKKKRALTFHINALFKIFLVPSINPRFHKEPFFYILDVLSRFYRTFYIDVPIQFLIFPPPISLLSHLIHGCYQSIYTVYLSFKSYFLVIKPVWVLS